MGNNKWLIPAIAVAGFLLLAVLFGSSDVRSGLRLFVLLILVLGVATALVNKAIVASQTVRPPSQPKYAYHAIIARDGRGEMIAGTYVIGLLQEGVKGYAAQPQFGTFTDYDMATKKADELNAETGLSTAQINRLLNRWA
jgi:hypothetical protein